ncbi:hypothetical protein BZG79_08090, partial [Salinivibrio sp. MA427]|uniref:Imm26 family immunity protein n=1 Tax=Salinivibrio sp. MA427 TaxID=1909455 RepID=UPI000989C693
MKDKKLIVHPGDVYFIPLFLHGESSAKSFSRYKFGGDDQDFCFLRVIDNHLGSGVLIEVFNYVGSIEADVGEIISSERLFEPIYIAGEGISKKRWRKVGETKDYDKETHSNYSSIQFLIGLPGEFRLWCNGIEYNVDTSIDKLENIEEHIILTSKQVEKRVLK